MKDVNKPLRTAFKAILAAATGWPVHDHDAPAGTVGNYVLLMNIDGAQIDVKDKFYNDVAITINLVSRSKKPSATNFATVDVAAGQTMTTLLSTNKITALGADFSVNGMRKDRDSTIADDNKTEITATRVLTFRSRILQIT